MNVWMILYIVVLFAAGYFLLIRPQQQRAKEQALLMAALTPGERIMTAGGIYGTIVRVEDDRIELRIAEGVVVDMARSSVVRKVDDTSAASDEQSASLNKPVSEDVEEPHVHVDGGVHDADAEAADDADKDE